MPGQIPIGQASPILTSAIRARYDELSQIKVNNLFRSWFAMNPSPDRYPIIEVRRGSEQVAVDVMRGHQGQRIQVSKFSQKAFDPFYFKQYFDATELTNYFRVFGSQSFNENEMAELANGVAVQNKIQDDMISRAEEIMCASVLESGTITSFRDGSIVDFKRQAGSIVTLTGGSTWDNAGTNPYNDLNNGGDYLRQTGKYGGYVINAIFGTAAWEAFRNNSIVQERLKEFNNKRDVLEPAQYDAIGGKYQGSIDCTNYTLRCWTMSDVYNAPTVDANGNISMTGTLTPYMNPKKIYMIPEKPMFQMLYGAIPEVRMPGAGTSTLIVGSRIFKDYANPEEGYHRFYLEAAPLPVPIQVDQIYTLQPIS